MVVSGSGTRPGSLKNILDEEHQQKHLVFALSVVSVVDR